MIDTAVKLKGIPNPENGLLLVFPAGAFPDASFEVEWITEDGDDIG
jgi:hypothetical protein